MKQHKKREYFVTKQIGKSPHEFVVAKFPDKGSANQLMKYIKKHGYKSKYRLRIGGEII